MIKKIFLIEVGTEEIPAQLLYDLSLSFYNNFINELNSYNIIYKKINLFFTPRRLALQIIDIDVSEKKIEIKKRGPSIIDSFDKSGMLTESARRWMKHLGIKSNQTEHLKTKKGEWLLFRIQKKQENIKTLLPKIIEVALKKIIIKKSMRWEVKNQKFLRPIRNIVMLLDNEIIPGKIFNIPSNNFLHNHISSQEKKIVIQHAKEYPSILFQKNNIIANYNIRKQTIVKEIEKISKKINGCVKINNILLKEVTNLVESPVVLLAEFQKKFLIIPEKILIYTIEKQQKCFPIYNSNNEIMPYFIFISNINSKEPKKIVIGNEKVMHSRLSDTKFFFENDRKIKLEKYLPFLKKILFHDDLGTLYEKTLRIKYLIEWISKYTKSNIKDSIKSAILSKCDLVTDMACEFPELQGTIGMYYSLADHEKKDIAIALQEQYLPSFSGDSIPSSLIGSSLSIADKIDTLSGMFFIGKTPTADKDPFALRRLCLGIIRIIIVNNIPLDLKKLINKSLFLYNKKNTHNTIFYHKIVHFFKTRLFHWYENQGYNIKIIQSVLSCELTQLIDIDKRIQSISYFEKLSFSKSIILSIKRISNILEKNHIKIIGKFNYNLIEEQEEKNLFNEIENIIFQTNKLFKEKKYKEILLKTKNLEKPIEDFFNKVKIHHFNSEIELNRLILLTKLEKFFLKIANFSFLY